MEFPKGFRFDSEFDLFCKAVDTAEKLIQFKALFLLFGFEEDVKFFRNYTDEQFDSSDFPITREDFDYILDNEIIYLVNAWLLSDTLEGKRAELEAFLAIQKFSAENTDAIVNLYLKKMKYVNARLLSENSIRRSDFKIFTTNKKLLEFDWDICRYIFEDNREQPYVQIKLSVLDDLPDIGAVPSEKPERVQFVCDSQDVNYLIEKLKLIHTRLEEDEW